MQFKHLVVAGLASLAAAQSTPDLMTALNSTANLSNLTSLVMASGLGSALGNLNNVTILAPSNTAITAFLNSSAGMMAAGNTTLVQALLQYHILNGSYATLPANATFVPTMLNNPQYSMVTGGQRVEVMNNTIYSGLRSMASANRTALNFTGGVIHVIDSVLSVPQSLPATLTAFNLTSAYGALNASGAFPVVGSLRDLTVFVPNNAAFRAVGSAVANLTQQQLLGILSYHVINGTVAYSTLLQNGSSVATLSGANVTITVRNSTSVFVNGARVLIPNLLVSDGVVHVIDEVLSPNNTAAPAATATGGAPAYSGATSATDELFTSGQPRPSTSINTGSIQATATGGAGASSSSSGGAWQPKATNAFGAAALGGLALIMQL